MKACTGGPKAAPPRRSLVEELGHRLEALRLRLLHEGEDRADGLEGHVEGRLGASGSAAAVGEEVAHHLAGEAEEVGEAPLLDERADGSLGGGAVGEVRVVHVLHLILFERVFHAGSV